MEMSNSITQSVVDALTKNYLLQEGEANSLSILNTTALGHEPTAKVTDLTKLNIAENKENIIKRQGFRIGEVNMMVRYEDGNKLIEMPDVFPIPNSPQWMVGFANIQGTIVPVFDLQDYLNTNDADVLTNNELGMQKQLSIQKHSKMVFVVEHGENASGFVINNLLERLEIDEKMLQANTSIVPSRIKHCIHASYLVNKELWLDIEVKSLLDGIEGSIVAV